MTSPLGRYASAAPGVVVPVLLIDAPTLIWQRAAEHHDELMREMALLALASTQPALPHRLKELIDILGRQYGAATGRPDDQRDEAVAQGRDRIDVRFEVPPSAASAAQRMRDLLEELEEYCRNDLLTLAQPEVQVRFGRWYIDQIVRQCAGELPTPWAGPWS